MECTLALVADAANREEKGKLNVLGVFDQITADKFPYAIPQFFIVVRFSASPAEFGLKKEFQIVLLDPDGKPMARIGGKGAVPTPDSGGRASLELILGMANVPFQRAGRHAISILVGGEEKGSIPLDVVQDKGPTRAKRRGVLVVSELARTAVSPDVRRKLIRKELRLKSSSPEFEERGASTQGNVIIFRTKKFPGAESDLIQRMFMLSVKAVEDEW